MQLREDRVNTGNAMTSSHNPEIDWKKGEVEMMYCPPICGRRKQEVKEKKVRKMNVMRAQNRKRFPTHLNTESKTLQAYNRVRI